MDDLISRQAAIDAFMEILDRPNHAEFLFTDEICGVLGSMPSAQTGIIRCKECLMHGVCRFEQGLGLDGFCSKAERRTDE